MFHYKTNFAIVLILTTFFMFCCSTRSKTDHNCDRTCGEHTLQYPFGFSSGCKVRLNCSSSNNVKRIKIDMLEVQSVTSDSIFVSLPAKCNRSVDFIDPLFGRNFAPTLNNTFLVQSCKSNHSGCVIQTSTFVNQVEGCDSNGEDIRCFTQKQLNGSRVDVLTRSVWTGIRCRFLFSALAFDKSKVKELSLQFQMLELGWWLQGKCNCSNNASCTEVLFNRGQRGFRCRCDEGFDGDGFKDGNGCRRASKCNASTLWSGGCRKAIKIGVLVGGILIGATLVAALSLLCYFTKRRSSWLRKQVTVKRLLREAAGDSIVPLYPYKEIERATNFFSDKHRLGTGAFGTVYAGNLHNDEWVAIKKIKYRDTNSVDQVMNEIKLLSSVSHPNLVRLLGCCIEGGEQILGLNDQNSKKKITNFLKIGEKKEITRLGGFENCLIRSRYYHWRDLKTLKTHYTHHAKPNGVTLMLVFKV